MDEEKVVAIISPTSAAGEPELMNEVTEIEAFADSLVVENAEDFKKAGEFGVLLKSKIAEVKEFFLPMKSAAHLAHAQICGREKNALKPLQNAEAIVKDKINKYALELDRKIKEAEEEIRRINEEEANKKLEEAIAAEQAGDSDKAKYALIDAEIADMQSRSVVVETEKQEVKGVSVQTDWEITQIEEIEVPDYIYGVCIRPVDTTAVMKLIRSSKGTIKIDGIHYQEKKKIGFRRS